MRSCGNQGHDRPGPLSDPGYAAAFREHSSRSGTCATAPAASGWRQPDPAVAGHALTGARPLRGLGSALLLSDGASRPADLFGLASFADLVAAASTDPADVIRQVRAAGGGPIPTARGGSAAKSAMTPPLCTATSSPPGGGGLSRRGARHRLHLLPQRLPDSGTGHRPTRHRLRPRLPRSHGPWPAWPWPWSSRPWMAGREAISPVYWKPSRISARKRRQASGASRG